LTEITWIGNVLGVNSPNRLKKLQIFKNLQKSIAKFSYLRELLGDNVRREFESLPFISEGYNRAKAILEEKYGKEAELVKSYVKEILSLPYISTANSKKIAEFSDKLTYCVQSLQSLKKLDEVKGLTMVTIEKLPGIWGDLVRSDSNWETCNLDQLAEAVRLWIRRNPVDHSRDDDQVKKRRERERMYLTNRTDKPSSGRTMPKQNIMPNLS
jgi:hypothetical protein